MMLFLCGFMGCGKTTVGKAAQEAGIPFVDLDDCIEEISGQTIAEIFTEGEDAFRTVESMVLKFVIDSGINSAGDRILALGGGTIINPDNAKIINNSGVSIFIDTDFDTCYERIKGDPNRPVACEKSRDELEKLYNERRRIYLKHAKYTIDGNGGIDTIKERIVLSAHDYIQRKNSHA